MKRRLPSSTRTDTPFPYTTLVRSTFGKFGVDLVLGGNQRYVRMEYNSVTVQDFVQPGLYTIRNGRVKDPLYSLSERQENRSEEHTSELKSLMSISDAVFCLKTKKDKKTIKTTHKITRIYKDR